MTKNSSPPSPACWSCSIWQRLLFPLNSYVGIEPPEFLGMFKVSALQTSQTQTFSDSFFSLPSDSLGDGAAGSGGESWPRLAIALLPAHEVSRSSRHFPFRHTFRPGLKCLVTWNRFWFLPSQLGWCSHWWPIYDGSVVKPAVYPLKCPLWKGWPWGPYNTKFKGHFVGNNPAIL